MDAATWDVCCLPLRRNSIDVIVSDMVINEDKVAFTLSR